MKQLKILMALVLASSMMCGCANTETPPDTTSSVNENLPEEMQSVQPISISTDNLKLNVGDTTKVEIEDSSLSGLLYEISDTTTATVDKDGNITAIGHGATTLKVYTEDGLYSGVTLVEVTDPTLEVEELF